MKMVNIMLEAHDSRVKIKFYRPKIQGSIKMTVLMQNLIKQL
jgi:hypothetical protein